MHFQTANLPILYFVNKYYYVDFRKYFSTLFSTPLHHPGIHGFTRLGDDLRQFHRQAKLLFAPFRFSGRAHPLSSPFRPGKRANPGARSRKCVTKRIKRAKHPFRGRFWGQKGQNDAAKRMNRPKYPFRGRPPRSDDGYRTPYLINPAAFKSIHCTLHFCKKRESRNSPRGLRSNQKS